MILDRAAEIDLDRLRLGRLGRLREQLRKRDLAACVLVDPVNIRYATGARNMQVFHARNPARYLLVAAEGPLVLFEFISPRACRRSTRSARRSPYPGDVRVVGASPAMATA